jgi:hypothetical protein
MGNGARCGSSGRSDWRVRLATGVGIVAGAAPGLFVISPLVDIPGFWPGLIAFVAVAGVGGVLGRLVCGLLFRPSPGGPPNPPPPPDPARQPTGCRSKRPNHPLMRFVAF